MEDAEYKALDHRIDAVVSRLNAHAEHLERIEHRTREQYGLSVIVKRFFIGLADITASARKDIQHINSRAQEELRLGKD